MFPIEVFRATVGKLTDILRTHGIRFHITGGVTSIAYGEPRMTQDVDVVVDGQRLSEGIAPFLQSLAASDFIHTPNEVREAAASGEMFQLMDREESLKLDVYAREMIPGELGRSRQEEVFEGEMLPIASRADTILSKLVWISKGSHKSRKDVRYLMLGATDADEEFIRQTAQQFGLTDLLDEVLAEPDEIR